MDEQNERHQKACMNLGDLNSKTLVVIGID
jgi:hypothetical protein